MKKQKAWAGYVKSFIVAGDFSDNTHKSYRTVLAKFLADVSPWKAGWEDRAIKWKSRLTKSLSPRSVSHRITCVRSFLKWCQGMGYVTRNPMLAVKIRMTQSHDQRGLTDPEVKRLLNISSAKDSDAGKGRVARDRAILRLMLHTGLRITGTRMLDIKDFKKRDGFTLAYYIGKGHSGKDAFVVVPPAVMSVLHSYLKAGGRSFKGAAGPLFVIGEDDQKRISESGMRTALNRRFVEAGVSGPGVTVHSLRHTAATKAKASGASLEEVQRMLDHQSPTTTELYLHELDRMEKPAELGIDYETGGNDD